MHSLSKSVKMQSMYVDGTGTAFQAATGVDGGAVNSQSVDTLGYSSVCLRFLRGTATNAHVLDWKIAGSQNDTDWTDVTTTATITDVGGNATNRAVVYEIHKPAYRYYRWTYQRKTQNSAIDRVEALLYNPQSAAITQPTGAGGVKTLTVTQGV